MSWAGRSTRHSWRGYTRSGKAGKEVFPALSSKMYTTEQGKGYPKGWLVCRVIVLRQRLRPPTFRGTPFMLEASLPAANLFPFPVAAVALTPETRQALLPTRLSAPWLTARWQGATRAGAGHGPGSGAGTYPGGPDGHTAQSAHSWQRHGGSAETIRRPAQRTADRLNNNLYKAGKPLNRGFLACSPAMNGGASPACPGYSFLSREETTQGSGRVTRLNSPLRRAAAPGRCPCRAGPAAARPGVP